MKISQVFFSDNPGVPLPPAIQTAVDSVRANFPDAEHKLYNEQEVREIIDEHFHADVLQAFDKIRSYCCKADLARFCLLYLYGGWYFDVTVRVMQPMTLHGDAIDILAFRDVNRYLGSTNSCDGCVIYASKPEQDIFVDAIDKCVDHISSDYYGWNPLAVTGPIVWGDIVTDNFVPGRYVFGDVIELTPGYQNKNKAMVMPNGDIFAFKKKSGGGDLSALGAVGTNNYNELWQFRRLYK